MATRSEVIREVREEKLKKLCKLGIDPYPSKVQGNPGSVDAARRALNKNVEVAGRIMGWRGHGNVIFADLKGEGGDIQLWFQKNNLKKNFEILELFDVGDFIFAAGKVIKTKAGEITIDVSRFQLLTKSVLPLPSTWFGLKDVEERYRKRYLDTILNTDIKKRFAFRSAAISAMRDFLNERGYLEVETPTLQPVYGGGFARPFITHHNVLDKDFYLRISDEMYLKRLIVGGFEKVYEITKVFRNEGIDRDHNPEFTMFEAQIAYQDYNYGMDITEEMVEYVVKKVLGKTEVNYQGMKIDFKRPWKRYKLVDSLKELAGVDVSKWKTLADAKKAVEELIPEKEKLKELKHMNSIGEVIGFAFEELIEGRLTQPTFIYDYPVEVSPLAKKCEDERFTQRFETFVGGMEFGNNYSELNDPLDLSKRFIEEKKREKAGFAEAHQTDTDYLNAIEHGFPPTCGLGIGVDRLIMVMTDAPTIKEVILFPTLRPQK